MQKLSIIFLSFISVMSLILPLEAKKEGNKNKASITVNGTGEVSVVPDMVNISASFSNKSDTAVEAMQENAKTMEKILDFLKKEKVENRNIQTTSFTINPNYVYNDKTKEQDLKGYQANNQISINIPKDKNAGEVIDGLVTAGINNVNSVQFISTKTEEAEQKAMQEAIKDAKQKANLMINTASDGSQILCGLQFISESGGYMPRPMMYAKVSAMAESAAPSPQIMEGEQKINVNVNITWKVCSKK